MRLLLTEASFAGAGACLPPDWSGCCCQSRKRTRGAALGEYARPATSANARNCFIISAILADRSSASIGGVPAGSRLRRVTHPNRYKLHRRTRNRFPEKLYMHRPIFRSALALATLAAGLLLPGHAPASGTTPASPATQSQQSAPQNDQQNQAAASIRPDAQSPNRPRQCLRHRARQEPLPHQQPQAGRLQDI